MLTTTVLNLVKERRKKLLEDVEFLNRDMMSKAQRVEDLKKTIAQNLQEIKELDAVLWALDTSGVDGTTQSAS